MDNIVLQNITAASIGALVARLISHPFDTVKTRIQADTSVVSSNFITVFRQTITTNGISGLYRGLPISLIFSVPAVSTYLCVYDVTKSTIDSSTHLPFTSKSPLTHFVSAIIAEMCSGLFWTPLELIKNKQQVSNSSTYNSIPCQVISRPISHHPNVRDIVRRIYHTDGILGFFKGYWLSLFVFIPYSVVYFLTYEQLKLTYLSLFKPTATTSSMTTKLSSASLSSNNTRTLESLSLPLQGYLICAAISGVLGAAISNPCDRIKSIIQVSDIGLHNKDIHMTSVMLRLVHKEGWWQATTRGIGTRCLWAVPNVVIAMGLYESIKQLSV